MNKAKKGLLLSVLRMLAEVKWHRVLLKLMDKGK